MRGFSLSLSLFRFHLSRLLGKKYSFQSYSYSSITTYNDKILLWDTCTDAFTRAIDKQFLKKQQQQQKHTYISSLIQKFNPAFVENVQMVWNSLNAITGWIFWRANNKGRDDDNVGEIIWIELREVKWISVLNKSFLTLSLLVSFALT